MIMKKLIAISVIFSATVSFSLAANVQKIGPRGKNVKYENKSSSISTNITEKSMTGPRAKNVQFKNSTGTLGEPAILENKTGPRGKHKKHGKA
jgi:hypothetical protein